MYDGVLIPALILSEEDRMHGDLEEPTIQYIRSTARELIEEIGFRDHLAHGAQPRSEDHAPAATQETVRTLRVSCIPIRDEMDELGAMMLAQVLSGDRMKAEAAPVTAGGRNAGGGRVGESRHRVPLRASTLWVLPAAIGSTVHCAPAIRSSRIMIGIWRFAEDPNQAAQKISGGEEARVMTRLTEAAAEVRSFLGAQPSTASQTLPQRGIVESDLLQTSEVPDQTAA